MRASGSRLVAGVGFAVALCIACSNADYGAPAGSTSVDGTMTATIPGYGAWIANRTATATMANGALTIVGEDGNFKKVTLFLIGITVGGGMTLPHVITLVPTTADTVGFAEFRERFQTGEYSYTTYNGGHGVVTISQLSADHVTGTFDFVGSVPPFSAISPQLQSAVGGAFDLKVSAR